MCKAAPRPERNNARADIVKHICLGRRFMSVHVCACWSRLWCGPAVGLVPQCFGLAGSSCSEGGASQKGIAKALKPQKEARLHNLKGCFSRRCTGWEPNNSAENMLSSIRFAAGPRDVLACGLRADSNTWSTSKRCVMEVSQCRSCGTADGDSQQHVQAERPRRSERGMFR